MYEVLDEADAEWGIDGLTTALETTRELRPGEALDAILDAMLAHAAGRPLHDDVTLVLVDRLG